MIRFYHFWRVHANVQETLPIDAGTLCSRHRFLINSSNVYNSLPMRRVLRVRFMQVATNAVVLCSSHVEKESISKIVVRGCRLLYFSQCNAALCNLNFTRADLLSIRFEHNSLRGETIL